MTFSLTEKCIILKCPLERRVAQLSLRSQVVNSGELTQQKNSISWGRNRFYVLTLFVWDTTLYLQSFWRPVFAWNNSFRGYISIVCLFKSLVWGQWSDHLIYSPNSFKIEAPERQSEVPERLIKPPRCWGNHSEDLRLQLLRDANIQTDIENIFGETEQNE